MADRKTRDALLRLRRVNELTAQRDLVDARTALTNAEALSQRAGAWAADADAKLAAAHAEPGPPTAGRMAARERFVDRLRDQAARAHRRAKATAQETARARSKLADAQVAVETALRAREAAESQAAALEVRSERQKARREESAVEDRFGSQRRRRK